jgi:hypothetical protein
MDRNTATAESIVRKHLADIRRAGGVPNSRFYRALRAARALDAAANAPVNPDDWKHYRVTCANGREVTVDVHKTSDIFKTCKSQGIEMVSFVKI